MNDEREARLVDLAESHHGVFAARELAEVGLTSRWRDNRVAQGRIVQVRYGAYRFAGTPLSWKGELLAAVWAGGPRGRASHRSAAALLGLAGGDIDLVEITCPRWRRARHENLIVHETKAFAAIDTTTVAGVPVTACERTLLDLGAVVGPLTVEMALDDALRKHHVTIESVRRMLRRTGRPGRNGAGVLREILTRRVPGRPAESRPERAMVRMLRRHGLPDPVLQHEVRDERGAFVGRVDAAYPQWRVAVEYQSYEHHAGGVPLVRDSKRINVFRAAKWAVVLVTAPDLLPGGGAEVAAAIRTERDSFGVRNDT